MKKIFGLLVALLSIAHIAGAQQQPTIDSSKLQGSWMLFSVQAEIYAQSDDRLLDKRVINPLAGDIQWRAPIATNALFQGDSCLLGGYFSSFKKFSVSTDGMLMTREKVQANMPELITAYPSSLSQTGVLTITLPAANYQDPVKKWAVKIVYQCQFKRN